MNLRTNKGSDLRRSIEYVLQKHLPGKHDQSTHGRRSNASAESDGVGGGGSPLDFEDHVIRIETGRHIEKVTLKNGETRDKEIIDFDYQHSAGSKLDSKTLQRIKSVKVPPGVTNVQISLDPNAMLQAVWQDSKGRDVYLYSKEHARQAAAEKFERLKDFNDALPQIRKTIESTLYDKNADPETRDVAAVLYLIDKTGFRVGSDTDTKAEKQAYGASTLLGKHVKVDGDSVIFDFVGKKGVDIHKRITDPIIADIISTRKTKNWSQKLFQVSDDQVRTFLKQFGDFKVKDFRTWNGTNKALEELAKVKRKPKSESEFKKVQRKIADAVAKHLGNTASVCLSAYIDPSIWGRIRKEEWGAYVPPSLKGD